MYPSVPESLVIYMWINGFAGQFRSLFVSSFLSQFALDHALFWYYSKVYHGKDTMEGIGGTIKHCLFRGVKSKNVNARNAEHFTSFADTILTGITSLYIPLGEVLTETESIVLERFLVL